FTGRRSALERHPRQCSGTRKQTEILVAEQNGHLARGGDTEDIAAGETEGTGLRRPRPNGVNLDGLTRPRGPVHDRVSVGRKPRRTNRALTERELAVGGRRFSIQTSSYEEASDNQESPACQDRGEERNGPEFAGPGSEAFSRARRGQV